MIDPDEDVLSEIEKGNQEAYRKLIKKYNQRLYRIAIGYGIYDDDCDDVIQQTYIIAYEQLNKFERRSLFSTWLIKILINNCLMLKRKQKIENKIFDYTDNNETLKSLNFTPDKQLEDIEINQLVEKAIKELPDKYKTVFMMSEIEGLSVKETADCLNISTVNVKVRLHRSKNMLKDFLKLRFSSNNLFTFGNERCERMANVVLKAIIDGRPKTLSS